MSSLRAQHLILAVACIALSRSALAQTAKLGDHVRVVDATTNGTLMSGTLVRIIRDSVTLLSEHLGAPEPYTTWGVGRIHRLEVRTVEHRGTAIGSVIGLLGGAVAGYAIGAASASDPDPASTCDSPPTFLCGMDFDDFYPSPSPGAVGAIGGALAGALLGAIVGHAFKTETWQRVGQPPVRVTVAPAPGRGVVIGAAIAF